ncbi:hypothetical protein Y900_030105 [Mycolicibacterium aromaticivorans JS19b1 = JCM 16368]|uniref:F5/8 type C domain-containing protein n=1 Tax=Mycolicibacterium aromaticivorans JS19b1 = JCM 16368 TaxID=1440774 RepID=A0A064C8E8_9MYCO|nr:hypothetical protein [Mycolicibacterium aromaticivorans]KDE96889.1 hypothetical protein Y900_030105 [Mycolicibacterium aromaticivorans JS19b1 = JCM 16368]
MSADELMSDEEWVRGLHGSGTDTAYDTGGDSDLAEVDVAALMADDDDPSTGPVDLDSDRDEADGDQKPARFDHKLLWGFGGVVAAAVVAALVGAVAFYSTDAPEPTRPGGSLSEPQAVAVAKAPPSPAPAAGPGVDRPLPYTADAQNSCAEGSTPAQTMSGMDPHNAFVCVRAGGDGQVITIDLGRTYVLTAFSLTPGWVGQDASGVSQWSQHRVVTIVQWSFPDDPSLPPVMQNTQNVHGEAVQPIKRVLASRIQMLIRYTSRPPANPVATPTPAPGGGLTSVFGDSAPSVAPPPATDPVTGSSSDGSDPVDATFAISALKIIGHEAV